MASRSLKRTHRVGDTRSQSDTFCDEMIALSYSWSLRLMVIHPSGPYWREGCSPNVIVRGIRLGGEQDPRGSREGQEKWVSRLTSGLRKALVGVVIPTRCSYRVRLRTEPRPYAFRARCGRNACPTRWTTRSSSACGAA